MSRITISQVVTFILFHLQIKIIFVIFCSFKINKKKKKIIFVLMKIYLVTIKKLTLSKKKSSEKWQLKL
jgi:hypothetical protein